MSEEEIQRTIAEACGWKPPVPLTEAWWANCPDRECRCQFCGCHFCDCKTELAMPDYLNDLNAMHEAEKALSKVRPQPDRESDAERYRFNLCAVTIAEGGPIMATAKQRAEAFIKTISPKKGPTQ